MLYAKFSTAEVERIIGNVAEYSKGFLDGIDLEKIVFMNMLAEFVVDALYKYIDAQARGNPDALHHVYEWGGAGSPGARLYTLNAKATSSFIHIGGNFLPSSSVSDTATEPFTDKANIMENRIAITVSPRDSDVLVFDYNGQTVFTMNDIYIANPGGDEVAGSFGRTVETFFGQYLTNMLLAPFFRDLERAEEFTQNFRAGSRGGYPVGVKAGREYLRLPLGGIE